MAHRLRRQLSLPDQSDKHASKNMDQLAFKYMEMCKMESSTDSDSEISPRWSDTSTMGCASSAPESRTFRRTLPLTYKPAGRHGCYSLFLDPYDGSSEDSDELNVDAGVSGRRTRQQGRGGCRFVGRSRRCILQQSASVALREVVKKGMRDSITEQQHLLDVQMKCGVESDLLVCELDILPSHSATCRDPTEEMANDATMHTQTMDMEFQCQFDDSDLHTTRSSTLQTPGPVATVDGSLSRMLESSSKRSPCNLRSLNKRKLGLPGAGVVELGQRKRQCVVNMDEEQEGGDSTSKPCKSCRTLD